MARDPEPLKEILYRTTARYLTVRPDGLDLPGRLRPVVEARVRTYGAARTLYEERHPACRSLDGTRSLEGRLCAKCPDRTDCTPQVRVELLVEKRPYRLLLAFTSARNFLLYCGKLKKEGRAVEEVTTRIRVLNRGTWGELRFEVA